MNTMTTITVVSLTAFASFLLTAVLGRWLVPALHRLKFGQTIRDIGPAWHKNKQGTPTMGGIMFALGMVIALVAAILVCELFLPVKIFRGGAEGNIVNTLTTTRLITGILLALFCGMIGFLDDYIKVVKKRNLGLTEKQKLFLQLVVALAYALSLYMAGGTGVYIPGLGEVDFGLWFIPFCMLVVVSATNAVNLTDGIDGLCGTVSFVVTLFFLVAAGITGYFG
ncbi:MAG: phospho-N-acetylmuramoyl-pentapeptide-transferase, partial [Clostridiales bacterium]|nr:phospho-N-acetylmuramoyl-pentapeptide-transferase [Clostridiales bacterium]